MSRECKTIKSLKAIKVALISFGEISSENIINSLIRLAVDFEVLSVDETPTLNFTHIILSGGPYHIYDKNNRYDLPDWVINSNKPVLGICYGMQLIAYHFGGMVEKMTVLEKGPVEVTEIVHNVQRSKIRWMNRYDRVKILPDMFFVTGVTTNNDIASFTDNKKWWAVQYHPESPTHGDLNVIRSFLLKRSCK